MSVQLEKGFVPVKTVRFGGQVDWDDAVNIPNGLAIVCQNMQFLAESVKTRWGLRTTASDATVDGNPTGVDVLTVLGDAVTPSGQGVAQGVRTQPGAYIARRHFPLPVYDYVIAPNVQVALVFTDTGELLLELPAGSGVLVTIPNTRIAASIAALLPVAAVMQTAKAYNRIYQAYTNLQQSSGPVLALDAATGFESPVGQNPIAAVWTASTFYQQGDIVTSSTNPAVWFRRLNTGYSGTTEPIWPAALGFFTPTYEASYATTTDGGSTAEWQEWTPGFLTYLPTPSAIASIAHTPSGGTIGSGLDVYVVISYFNNLGESLWSVPIAFLDTSANDELTCSFGTSNPASGPPMPSWLMSVMNLGTTGAGLHWPSANCINVYVASVTHGDAAPTQFRKYGVASADGPLVITSVPGSGTQFTAPIAASAGISAQQFMGEAGIRNAILLRQNTMGDLSPVDPQGVIPVQFLGAIVQGCTIAFNAITGEGQVYLSVNDITQYSIGMNVFVQGFELATLAGADVPGLLPITEIYPGNQIGSINDGELAGTSVAYPAGMIVCSATLAASTAQILAGTVTIEAGPCPVAVVPPGVSEGPGYSYDTLAFTVVGLGVDGPFNYLATANPANPFSTAVLSESTDGSGDGQATVASVQGLSAGETVAIAGWTGGNTALNGQRVLATVGAVNNIVTFPDPFTFGVYPATGITMSVVQTQPTQVPPAILGWAVGILLQFDDSTLPEGVDVTGNLLFVALPPCIDLAYLPSVQRMAYVTDQQPTSLIFSEVGFMGEVDGVNDVLAIEQSNGARVVGARELLNGVIVACKENGGYQVVPTADVPANWGLNRLWGGKGPWSGRNIATGRDGQSGMDFMIFVDPEAGVYKWPSTLGEGEVDWLSMELSGANNQDASRMATWDRVNRAAGWQIQVVVDTIAKEIKIAVPLDGATTPSHILTMSYFNGWQGPLMMTLSGDWVPSRTARRWNIDPIPTRALAMVKRTLATPIDQRVNYHQLIIGAWASTPGKVALNFMQPGVYDDLGAAYLWRYRPAYAKEVPSQDWPNGGRVLRFLAAQGIALGSGVMYAQAITDDPTYEPPPQRIPLDNGQPEVPGSAPVTHYSISLKGDSEFLTVELSNEGPDGPEIDSWAQLCEHTNWHKPLFPTR